MYPRAAHACVTTEALEQKAETHLLLCTPKQAAAAARQVRVPQKLATDEQQSHDTVTWACAHSAPEICLGNDLGFPAAGAGFQV